LTAQNLRSDDITSVIAGRDIYTSAGTTRQRRTSYGANPGSTYADYGVGAMMVSVGGPGTVYVEAGRNIGPLAAAFREVLTGETRRGGIIATGPANNRSRPQEGADIYVLTGVANGKNVDGMISSYLDPANAAAVPYSYGKELAAYLNELRRKRGET